jgi:membrane protein involved in colicin uptake
MAVPKLIVLHSTGSATQVFWSCDIKRIEAHGGGDLGAGLFSKVWVDMGTALVEFDVQEPFDLIMSMINA